MLVCGYELQVDKNTGRPYYGVVPERPIGLSWKGSVPKGTVSSNLTDSANYIQSGQTISVVEEVYTSGDEPDFAFCICGFESRPPRLYYI